MCDAVAADIRREHTRQRRVTKEGEAMAAAIKRASDAIWAMHEALKEKINPGSPGLLSIGDIIQPIVQRATDNLENLPDAG